MTLGRAWGEGTCATGMGGLTALSASAQTGAQSEHRISGKAFQQSKWCRIKSPVTLHPGTRQLSPLQSATCLNWSDTLAQPGTVHTCAFAWPLAAGQDSAWRMSLNRERVLSMYRFSSLPRAISAATAMASWASSSSEEGAAAASRGRGASMLACAVAAWARTLAVFLTTTRALTLGSCVSPVKVAPSARRGSACHGCPVGAWLWRSSAAGFHAIWPRGGSQRARYSPFVDRNSQSRAPHVHCARAGDFGAAGPLEMRLGRRRCARRRVLASRLGGGDATRQCSDAIDSSHRLEPSTRRWTLSTPSTHKRGVTCAADASEACITTKC